MIRINLLPYREAKRKELARRRTMLVGAGAAVMGLLFYAIYLGFDHRLQQQQARVDFLRQEIAQLDVKIRTIADIKQQRETMLAKLNVVEKLQKDRGLVVQVFNELAARTPDGVFLTHVQEGPQGFLLEGYAESNGQISELMRNLEASSVFTAPRLEIISKSELAGSPVGQFKMQVSLRPTLEGEVQQQATSAGKGAAGQ